MFKATKPRPMRKLLSISLFLLLSLSAFGQTGDVTLDRFSVNQSATLNYFQSPQYLYGNVEFQFAQNVTMVEVAVKMRDGTGKTIGGAAVTKQWASASAGQELEFDYTYYNPSAVQQFEPVLVISAKGDDGSHIMQTFEPKQSSNSGDGINY